MKPKTYVVCFDESVVKGRPIWHIVDPTTGFMEYTRCGYHIGNRDDAECIVLPKGERLRLCKWCASNSKDPFAKFALNRLPMVTKPDRRN